MRKYLLWMALLCASLQVLAQDAADQSSFQKLRSNFYGSFESNAQMLLDDDRLNVKIDSFRLRSNNYLNLNYKVSDRMTAGVQIESYAPRVMMNYHQGYKGTNISNYYLSYQSNKWDVTLGHFYEQFGSGLILRSFEDRALGLNNALRGAKIAYAPADHISITALYGRPRIGFSTAKSDVFGFNSEVDLLGAFRIEKLNALKIGLSYVGRYQPIEASEKIQSTEGFPEFVNAVSIRADVDFGKFYTNSEYVRKGKDVSYPRRRAGRQQAIEGKYYDGEALLLTAGYAKKGFAVSSTLRRMRNMSFFARRNYVNPAENTYGMLSVNFIPSLAKQYSYSLANIYLYQAQPNLVIADYNGKAGEIGGAFDIYYVLKKGSVLGGKYGTKISANFSHWALLKTDFDQKNNSYSTSPFGFGEKLNRNISIEIKKKISKKVSSKVAYLNSSIDKGIVNGSPFGIKQIDYQVLAASSTIKLKKHSSIKLIAEHLWTDDDQKNWIANTIEYNLNRHVSVYINNMYNYGNEKEKVNYYNAGGSYSIGATRIALNYGRQRGGLMCTGGVCRYVSPNNGFTMSMSTAF